MNITNFNKIMITGWEGFIGGTVYNGNYIGCYSDRACNEMIIYGV